MNRIKPSLIRKNQSLSKPEDSLKVWGGPTTTPPFYTPWNVSSSPFHLVPFAVVAGFGRNAEDEHVASRAVPGLQQDRRQRRTGASSGRRPGWWGRSTGAPGQLEDRLPRLGCGHSEEILGCLEFESFDFDFDFGWIFWGNVWSLIFC